MELREVTRLIFIRHGRIASNDYGRIQGTKDEGLDATGIQQAELVARRMESFAVSKIYSSPLQRAYDTAAAVAGKFNLEVTVDEDLIEYEFGELSDKSLQELRQTDPRLHARVEAWMNMGPTPTMRRPRVKGAELISRLGERVNRFKDKVVDNHPGEVVVAVSHGGYIRAFLTVLTYGRLQRRFPFWIDNASISVIDFYKGVPCIRLFNDICHLDMELSYGRPLFL